MQMLCLSLSLSLSHTHTHTHTPRILPSVRKGVPFSFLKIIDMFMFSEFCTVAHDIMFNAIVWIIVIPDFLVGDSYSGKL